MSLINDASLVLTPNAVKEGKLYSIIPSNGNGDMTVVRATTATRVNELGLIEPTPYNLLGYSEDFANIYWSLFQITISVDVVLSPSGIQNADKIIENSTSNFHGIFINSSFSVTIGETYTRSVYAKADGRNWIALLIIDGTQFRAYFDLQNGVIGNITSGITAVIENAGNGWYRCSITRITTTSSISSMAIELASSNGVNNYLGNGTSGAYIWGSQLVQGSVPKDYFYTTNRLNVPRLNYDGSCPSILVEPQRTNLYLYSENFDNLIWTKQLINVTTDNTVSPDGLINADKVIPNTSNGFHNIKQTVNVTNGIVYTFSGYFKSAGYDFLLINTVNGSSSGNVGPLFNLSNGTLIGSLGGVTYNAQIISVGNGWYRISFSFTTSSTNVIIDMNTLPTNSIVAYSGNGTSGIYIWGAQLELGAYQTSYIPTVASSVTRNSDTITKTGISDLIGQTEGTFFIDFQNKANEITTGVVVRMLYTITDGTNNNRISLAIVKTATRNYTDITIRTSNVTVSNINVDTTTGSFKIAVSYKIGATKMFINGVLVGNVGLSEIPIINRLFLGCSTTSGAENANVGINTFLTVKSALTDSECIALTTL